MSSQYLITGLSNGDRSLLRTALYHPDLGLVALNNLIDASILVGIDFNEKSHLSIGYAELSVVGHSGSAGFGSLEEVAAAMKEGA